MYKPLKITTDEIAGLEPALRSMRYPMEGRTSTKTDYELSQILSKRGDDHSKHLRGILVWATLEYGLGFGIELETYSVGVVKLPCTSTMHNELIGLAGLELAEAKQKGLSDKYYKRGYIFSYQTLSRIDQQRKNHALIDWQIFRDWIKTLPYYSELIYNA